MESRLNRSGKTYSGEASNASGAQRWLLPLRTDTLPYYIAAIILGVMSYYFFNLDMERLLLPHKTVLEFLYDFDFIYVADLGYTQTNDLFTITRGCSGTKLFVSLFLILVFGFLPAHAGIQAKIAAFSQFYISALLLAFLVNVARIAVSLPFCNWERFYLIHNTISIFLYFATGLGLYFIMERRRVTGISSKQEPQNLSPCTPCSRTSFNDITSNQEP